MTVAEDFREAVFKRAGGRCECRRTTHLHIPRCSEALEGDWAVYQPVPECVAGIDSLYNLQGLCAECFEKVSQHDGAAPSVPRHLPMQMLRNDVS